MLYLVTFNKMVWSTPLLVLIANYSLSHASDVLNLKCIKIDISDVMPPPDVVVVQDQEYTLWKAPESSCSKIGKVVLGNTTYNGDCDYSSRIVRLSIMDGIPTIAEVQTLTNDGKWIIVEFAETNVDSNNYVRIHRQPLVLNLNDKDIPDEMDITPGTNKINDVVRVKPKFRHLLRVGAIILGDLEVPDCTECIDRYITLWSNGYTKIVSIYSRLPDDHLDTLVYQQEGNKTLRFEKYIENAGSRLSNDDRRHDTLAA